MESGKYDHLKLESQLCFPLYVCSKEIIRRYKPYLDEIDLTYTQYITVTLTPVLKKLEAKGYIVRARSAEDERNLHIMITGAGEKLRERAVSVPEKMSRCVDLMPEEAAQLYQLLYKILGQFKNDGH